MKTMNESIAEFASQCCSTAKFTATSTKDLWNAWIEWKASHPEPPASECNKQSFGHQLRRIFPHLKIRQGTNGRWYEGITLRVKPVQAAPAVAAVASTDEVLRLIGTSIRQVKAVLDTLHEAREAFIATQSDSK